MVLDRRPGYSDRVLINRCDTDSAGRASLRSGEVAIDELVEERLHGGGRVQGVPPEVAFLKFKESQAARYLSGELIGIEEKKLEVGELSDAAGNGTTEEVVAQVQHLKTPSARRVL